MNLRNLITDEFMYRVRLIEGRELRNASISYKVTRLDLKVTYLDEKFILCHVALWLLIMVRQGIVCVWLNLPTGGYVRFCRVNRLGVILLLPGWDVSPTKGYPSESNSPVLIICTPVLHW